jgi:serine/threonine protein kinase
MKKQNEKNLKTIEEKYFREVTITQKLNHKNIIKIDNFYIEEEKELTTLNIVMEYCEKGNLQNQKRGFKKLSKKKL